MCVNRYSLQEYEEEIPELAGARGSTSRDQSCNFIRVLWQATATSATVRAGTATEHARCNASRS